MAEAAKKTAESNTTDEQANQADSKTAEKLLDDYDKDYAMKGDTEIHVYTFADGTSAKVWANLGDTHVNVQLRDVHGRGTSDTTHEGVTVNAANKMLTEAGEKAAARKKPEGS